MSVEEAKKKVAERAVDIVLERGFSLIGVGTGSTVEKFIEELSRRRVDRGRLLFTSSSLDTALKLAENGFRVLDPSTVGYLEVYVDGADEVDGDGRMLKGGGGAMTLEKILSYSSRFNIFIVDYSKVVERLGEKSPLPVEVLPQAVNIVLSRIRSMGLKAYPRALRRGKYGPVVSDVGGVILDVEIPPERGAEEIAGRIESIPGVVSTGFFKGYIDLLLIGYADRVVEKKFNRVKGLHLAE
jgi:ribose 5-phosphate isomerase A